jgi:hypothetical protein
MPNIASVLKEEIRRLAHKELKANTDSQKKGRCSLQVRDAALKRRIDRCGIAGRRGPFGSMLLMPSWFRNER